MYGLSVVRSTGAVFTTISFKLVNCYLKWDGITQHGTEILAHLVLLPQHPTVTFTKHEIKRYPITGYIYCSITGYCFIVKLCVWPEDKLLSTGEVISKGIFSKMLGS